MYVRHLGVICKALKKDHINKKEDYILPEVLAGLLGPEFQRGLEAPVEVE